MCIVCHSNLSNEFLEKQISENLIRKNYEEVKTLNHYVLALYYNGPKIRNMAIQFIDLYLTWAKDHQDKMNISNFEFKFLLENYDNMKSSVQDVNFKEQTLVKHSPVEIREHIVESKSSKARCTII